MKSIFNRESSLVSTSEAGSAVVVSSDRQHNTRNVCLLSIFCLSILISPSCRKLVETDLPSDRLTGAAVFTTDATAIGVLNNIFNFMNGEPFQGNRSISLFAGLDSDEFTLYNGTTDRSYFGHYQNVLAAGMTGIPGSGYESWQPLFSNIFRCNAAIEELSKTNTITPIIKQQLLGESKFLRAFYYFYLVNLYGDVPLALSTDPEVNTLLARSSKAKVYEQIIMDLKEAEGLLSDNFLGSTLLTITTERVRPTKWAASAMLARVYLYKGDDWAKAEDRASAVINNTSLFGPLPALNDAFLKNSREAIWQLQPTDNYFNTIEARALCIPATGPSGDNPVYLSTQLLSSFEAGDQRAINGNWINSVTAAGNTYKFPFKYKKYNLDSTATSVGNLSEYFMVLRLGEQYLIRAEARAKQGNIAGAQSDLNAIRTRAGLPNTTASNEPSLLTAILYERQVELFSEWGHRWLDLKRTGTVEAVMNIVTPQKAPGTVWQSYQEWYPLDYLELQKAPNLTQTPGY